jgi:3-phytase
MVIIAIGMPVNDEQKRISMFYVSWKIYLAIASVVALVVAILFLQQFKTNPFFTPRTTPVVRPVVETTPVPHTGDAADDVAIWVHPTDPVLSTIIGTDKQGGLAVYDLNGSQLQYRADGDMNNVDLHYNFPLSSTTVSLVSATNSTNNSIAFYKVHPDTRLLEQVGVNAHDTGINVYGTCMYKSPVTGKFYVFVTADDVGTVQQWEIFDNGNGLVDTTLVRSLSLSSQAEGCVADDVHGDLYIAEEDIAIWKYGAEPQDGTTGVKVAATSKTGPLKADIEGLALYHTSDNTGYLIASSQGSSSFAVYDRADNAYVGTFKIDSGNGIDSVTRTDGIDALNTPLGSLFPRGLFIAQDGTNDNRQNQNFKLVPGQNILRRIGTPRQEKGIEEGRSTGNLLIPLCS